MLGRKIKKHLRQWQSFLETSKQFTPYLLKQKKRLLTAMGAGFGYTLFGMLEPWPLKMIFDNVFLDDPLPRWFPDLSLTSTQLLYSLIGSIVCVAFIRGLFYYYQQLHSSKAGQQIASSIRVDLYSHLQKLSFNFHDRKRTGDLLARLTSDIKTVREMLVSIPQTLSTELMLMAGMTLIMAALDWQLTLIALTVIPLLMLLLKKYRRPMKQAIRQQREREGHLTSIASEVLGAIKVVQGYHQEKMEVGRFENKNSSSLKSGLKASRLEAKLKWASELAVAIVTAVVLGVAGQRVMAGAISPGDLLVFTFYLRNFNRPLRRVSKMTERMARGTASGERILDMMSVEPEIQDIPDAVKAPRFQGNVRFSDVSFHYHKGPPVLRHIDLTVCPGERVALIGPTGSGKSTIASLLPRFYQPSKGSILIDGQDIRTFTLKSLREQIALVFQEPVLFATSIAENIAYGRPGASIEEIRQAAQKASIDPIISRLPDGYETILGERGGTLSGGQRQCISIARAMIKDSPIVILDEPTTGLDTKSCQLVLDALDELMQNKTVIMITHQLDTLDRVDRVIEIEQGELCSGDSARRSTANL